MYAEATNNEQITFRNFSASVRKTTTMQLSPPDVTKYLGLGIASVINALNPEMVVIGGEITNVKSLIFNSLLKEIKERTRKILSGVRLDFSQLGNRAAALGMGTIVLEKIINALS